MLYWRIAAVACTLAFVAMLVWLYGVRTTLIWAGGMAAFLLILWAATTPLRRRQRRVWREMGLGPDGRPLPAEEEEEDEATQKAGHEGDEAPAGDSAGAPAGAPKPRASR